MKMHSGYRLSMTRGNVLLTEDFSKASDKKAKEKILRRDRLGTDARQARDEALAEIKRVEAGAEALGRELLLPQLNESYVVARHRLLEEIARVASADEVAMQMIVELHRTAEIPEALWGDLTQVWHYYEYGSMDGEIRVVHFFFGGKRAPDYNGESPDGVGHGHYVLVNDKSGAFTLSYRRPPA